MTSFCSQGKSFNITVIQVYAATSNAEEADTEGSMKTYKNFENDRMISVCFQGKPFNITVIQVYALSSVIHWSTNYMDHQYLNWNYGQTSKSED